MICVVIGIFQMERRKESVEIWQKDGCNGSRVRRVEIAKVCDLSYLFEDRNVSCIDLGSRSQL